MSESVWRSLSSGPEKFRHADGRHPRCARWLNMARRSPTTWVMPRHAPPSAESQYEGALQTLRDHQHRVTEPRKAILAVLTHEHGPFTVEEIHQRMQKGLCDLVTVYRCIAAMEEINLVRR